MLYDPKSFRVTALLDFDFASISHPSYEFLRSFDSNGPQILGLSGEEDAEELQLRDAKLHGFPSPLPTSSKGGVDWESAKAFEDALERSGALRPRTIVGIEDVADVDAVFGKIKPWRLTNEDIVARQSDEVKEAYAVQCQKQLKNMLDRHGF